MSQGTFYLVYFNLPADSDNGVADLEEGPGGPSPPYFG